MREPPANAGADEVRDAVRQLVRGRSNAWGEVTLTAGVTTTTVTAAQVVGVNSSVHLMPMTANAAAALGTTWVTTANGSFVLTHTNNAQTDRKFRWGVIG